MKPRDFGFVLFFCIMLMFSACKRADDSNQGSRQAGRSSKTTPAIEIVFTYGSEKEKWVNDVTAEFNQAGHKISNGKTISVEAIAMGSGECIDDLITGRTKAHITSPASAAFIKLGNASSRTKTGKDLIGPTENLVLSPVVIAMWKPMAESLGWPERALGWSDILALAQNEQGWASYGHPEWGSFKFGHTHPEHSNSGLISLFAEVYAAAGKTSGLTLESVRAQTTASYLSGIEKSIVHYGSSTGFFGRTMFANGPSYLSAAVLYENMVIESYLQSQQLVFPIVAIYPKEGTFWSDHPAGIVQREWVGADEKEASGFYLKFLLDKKQQEKALKYGFRPAAVDVPTGPPVDMQHGVNPAEPKTTLEVPPVDVIDAIIELWKKEKKHSELTLVFDVSGSMKEENRINNARDGALQFLNILSDDDVFTLLPFSDAPRWGAQRIRLRDGRNTAIQQISSLFPSGGTALYDAIYSAHSTLLHGQDDQKISAIVVLTDGEDTNSKIKLPELLRQIGFDGEKKTIRVFTIGYGSGANEKILKGISEATRARYYQGSSKNIQAVFKEISTFF